MKSTTLMFLAFAGTTLPLPAAVAQSSGVDLRRTISVHARSEVSVAADRAIVSIAVETVQREAHAAVAENAERSSRTAKAIRALLGKDDQVSTTRYSLQPRYEHIKGETEARITGYVASNEVRVETRDLEAVGKIVDAAIRAGANRIGSLQFTIGEREEPARQALESAGQRARQQAETLAGALGVKIVGLISASTSESSPIQPRKMEMFAMTARDSMPDTPIEAGDVIVSADVHAVFEIE